MDLQIFQAINNLAGQWPWLDTTGIFFAKYAGLMLIVWLAYRLRSKIFTPLAAGLAARYGFVELIRALYERARPIPVDAVHQLAVNDKWSFPSGHASFFFAFSTVVFFYNKKLGLVCYGVSIFMGIARIFVGVHWPSDILAGAVLGIIVGYGVFRLSAAGRSRTDMGLPPHHLE